MPKIPTRALAALSLALVFALASCSSYEEVRLSTFDAAMALETTLPQPAFFEVQQVPHDLPLAAPFAQLLGDFPTGYTELFKSQLLNSECVERGFRPDFVVMQPRGLSSGGRDLNVAPVFSPGGYTGVAFSSTPDIRDKATAICYRLSPVSLGLVTDTSWMVTHVDESARQSGIQEGDSIQAIGGADVRPRTPQDVPPWLAASLQRKPADEVAIEWIRPGTGRMRGKLVLGARQPMPADAKPLPPPEWAQPRNR